MENRAEKLEIMKQNELMEATCYTGPTCARSQGTDESGYAYSKGFNMRKYLTVESKPIIATGTPITTGTEDIVK